MKKIASIMLVLLLCVTMVARVFAEDIFVPSISYKDGPALVEATMKGENVKHCLTISSIKAAQEKTTDISQADRELLLDVYARLADGSMKLPLGDVSYVVRELVDVSFTATGCQLSHDHAAWLAKKGNTATIKFDMGIDPEMEVTVLAYVDGEWIFAEQVTNNGDGTLTVVLEDICPVAFVLADGEVIQPDDSGSLLWLWIIILLILVALLIFFLLWKRRKDEEEKATEENK
jgi:hypothetical protein